MPTEVFDRLTSFAQLQARRRSVWFAALIAAGLPVLSGCGNEGPFEYVPVSGRVTYEDGAVIPAASLRLTFVAQTPPTEQGLYPRPAEAAVDVADGSFDSVTSYKPDDGLIPGRHKVLVTALDSRGQLSEAVPQEYRRAETTPLEVDTQDRPLRLRVRRPADG